MIEITGRAELPQGNLIIFLHLLFWVLPVST